jgi:hypothetical protein
VIGANPETPEIGILVCSSSGWSRDALLDGDAWICAISLLERDEWGGFQKVSGILLENGLRRRS